MRFRDTWRRPALGAGLAALAAGLLLIVNPTRPGQGRTAAPSADNGLARTPPMGWNSWNHFAARVTAADVRAAADALVSSGMRDAGYTYVNIDDTWEGGRDAQGHITTNKKFPDMKALCDYVHRKGLKIGIYSSPGPSTCAGYEGSYGLEDDDARTYARWGIDYLKYDWCSGFDNQIEAYAKMGRALRASGRPIVYSLCQYGAVNVMEWGPRVGGNLWRTTGDINDSWRRMSEIGFGQDGLEKYAGPGHWNDPDMLEVGNGGMSDTEYRTHFSLWCLLAAPLLAGNDLSKMTPGTVAILTNKEAIAVDQDRLGAQARRVRQDGDAEVWARPLQDGSQAVGLFNRGEAPASVTVQWTDVGLQGRARVRDLWAHADVGTFTDRYSATVEPHGAALLRIR